MDEDEKKAIEEQIKSLQEKLVSPAKPSTKTLDKEAIVSKSGLSLKANEDGSFTSNIEVEMVKKASKASEVRTRDSYKPTPDQLKKINETALEDQTEDSGYVFTFQATNPKNGVDRSLESIGNPALTKLGVRAVKNKIPYLLASEADCEDHTWKAINSRGFTFDAFVKDGALYYEVFMGKIPRNEDILDAMFTGAINKLSIGFSMAEKDFQCNSCKRAIVDEDCPHQPGQLDEKGRLVTMTIMDIADNYEISAVAVPCQQDAHVTRGAKSLDSDVKSLSKKALSETFEEKKSMLKGIVEKLEVNSELNVLLDSVSPEATESDSDKINNGKNTIEDNKLMDEDNKVVTLDEQGDKLCKTAERVKSEAVTEITAAVKSEVEASIKSQLEALTAIKEDVLAAVKSLDEKLSVLTANKALEDKLTNLENKLEADKAETVEAKLARIELLLEVNRTVPGSKTLVDMTNVSAKEATNSSPDLLLQAVK